MEWIRYEEPLSDEERRAYINKVMQPGTLLRMWNDDILLVGHVNKLFGFCDHCKYDTEDISWYSMEMISWLKDDAEVM